MALTKQVVEKMFGKIYQTSPDKFGLSWKVRCPGCERKALLVSEGLNEAHCFVCFWARKRIAESQSNWIIPEERQPAEPVRNVGEIQKEFAAFYEIDVPQSSRGKEYLLKRDVRNYNEFKLRYCPLGRFAGRVIIPIYQFDRLIGYQGRTVLDGVAPKYLFSKGLQKGGCLFNFDVARKASRTVIVVEGVIDAMKGSPWAVSTFGAGITERQLQLIAAYWDFCVLVPDNDEAGWIGFKKAHDWLVQQIFTRTVPVTGYNDLGEAPHAIVQEFVSIIIKSMESR